MRFEQEALMGADVSMAANALGHALRYTRNGIEHSAFGLPMVAFSLTETHGFRTSGGVLPSLGTVRRAVRRQEELASP